MNKKIIFIIIAATVIIIGVIITIILISRDNKQTQNERINIVWWQPFDTKEEVAPLIDEYQKNHPNVTITYEQINVKNLKEYEDKIVNALANGEGPDIWALKNDWLPKHYKKLAPLPDKVMNAENYSKAFFPIIKSDMTIKTNNKESIYGFPFSLDTLVLIYNTDQFNAAEIPESPATWNQLIKNVESLTKRNGNQIQHAGLACGTSNNIVNYFDILSLLMLQNGTQMVSDNKEEVYFNRSEEKDGKNYYPGTTALKFYTDFASPKKTAYTWNSSLGMDIDEFMAGKTSMMIGYSQDIWSIKKKAPKIKFAIATIPQAQEGDQIAYASFWSQVVSANSSKQKESWDFLNSCLNKETIQKYYEKKLSLEQPTPSSIVEIAKNQEGNQYIGPIVKQAPYARSWYEGDSFKMQEIFAKMITSVVSGQSPQAAIDAAAKSADRILLEIN